MSSVPLICVAIITYRRPEMLQRLLMSLISLKQPPEFEVRFIVIDNDPVGSSRPLIAKFDKHFSNISYILERQPGIPAARNRAMKESFVIGADLLAFIDDDEYPACDWLYEIVQHQRCTQAVLVGGPVINVRPPNDINLWQQILIKSISAHSKYMTNIYRKGANKGKLIKLATGNWLCDIQWTNRKNIHFDENVNNGRGSDTAFLEDVIRNGGLASWCSRAHVYEIVPKERLKVRKQFQRFKTFGLTKARIQRGSSPIQALRMIVGVGLMIFPVLGIGSYMVGLQLFAVGIGWFSGQRNRKPACVNQKPNS